MTDFFSQFMSHGLIMLVIAAAIILLLRPLTKPIKLAFKLLINAGIGFVLLFVVNWLGGMVGIHVAVTWITALIAGFFGVPGVIAIIFYNMFL